MMSQQYFTDAEWQVLLDSPRQAIIAMVLADKTDPVNFLKEVRAAIQILANESMREDVNNDVVKLMLQTMKEANANSDLQGDSLLLQQQFQLLGELQQFKNADEGLQKAQSQLQQAASILASKVSIVQAEEYKKWLLSLAQKVAEAVKEGGLMGGRFGGEVISREEASVLKRMERALSFKV